MNADDATKFRDLETPLRRTMHRITGIVVILSTSALTLFLIDWFSTP
jgi:hypothetical protein